MMIKQFSLSILSLVFVLNIAPVLAGGDHHKGGNNACPVESPYPVSFTTMFGADVEASMRCNKKRHKVKLVVQVNKYCRDGHYTGIPVNNVNECKPGRAYALGNMKNMINDYEKTHGMRRGKDYKMIAVVHSGGGHLLRADTGAGSNPYADDVKDLMDKGVEFYFCLNTAAGFIKKSVFTRGNLTEQLVDPRVKFVPAGLTSITDFQKKGFIYVQP